MFKNSKHLGASGMCWRYDLFVFKELVFGDKLFVCVYVFSVLQHQYIKVFMGLKISRSFV